MMNSLKKSWVGVQGLGALLSFAIAGSAFAGGIEGGGGKAVVCRDQKRAIRSAEVLDLYEGRAIYGFIYAESKTPWAEQARAALDGGDDYPKKWLPAVVQYLRVLPRETSLVAVNDSLETVVPRDCAIEQAANYINDQQILVDGEIWGALSETGKAALAVHEASYRYLREFGDTDSRRARIYTAHRMAGKTATVPSLRPGVRYGLMGPVVFAPFSSTRGFEGSKFFGVRGRGLRQISPHVSVGGEVGLFLSLSQHSTFVLMVPMQAVGIYEFAVGEESSFKPYVGLGAGLVFVHGNRRVFETSQMRAFLSSQYELLIGTSLDARDRFFAELRLGSIVGDLAVTPSVGWYF